METANSVALVTGGASGLGYATASALAAAGATVAVVDATAMDQAALQAGGLVPFQADVSSASQMQTVFSTWLQAQGRCDLVVNCAGIAPAKRMVNQHGDSDLELFTQVMQVNLLGTYNVMRLAAAAMQGQSPSSHGERGVIINTSSVAAYEGQIGQTAYSAAKGGVAAMTLPAARELAQHGIRVMTIAPGIMHTPMMASMPEKVQQGLHETVPFPKRLGQADEFAQLVLHIQQNRYLNGEVIRLDGALRLS